MLQVGLIESGRLGGTCVNVGCVPKKIMVCASNMKEEILHDAEDYGLDLSGNVSFDWKRLTEKREAYIERLNGIYQNNGNQGGGGSQYYNGSPYYQTQGNFKRPPQSR